MVQQSDSQAPDLRFEEAAGDFVCGIDEVGRGPLAGPVMACALILDRRAIPAGIDDSKRLSRTRREALIPFLLSAAWVGIGRAEAREIDHLNILQATCLAMERAVAALPRRPRHALVDGNRAPALSCPVTTIVGGDRRSLSIAAASIVAKVLRDRVMKELAGCFPGYGWERNAGYGTAEHLTALSQLGPTAQHRQSFAPLMQFARYPKSGL